MTEQRAAGVGRRLGFYLEHPDVPQLSAFILSHLCVFSYVATAAALDQETSGGVRKFEVCDNVDLEMMLLEFESYHYIKFHKFPKVIRKVPAGSDALGSSKSCSLEAGGEVGHS